MPNTTGNAEKLPAQRTYTISEEDSAAVAKGAPVPGFNEDDEFAEANRLGLTFDPDLSGEDVELVQENLYQEAEGRSLAPEERQTIPEEGPALVDSIMIDPLEAVRHEDHPTGLSEHSIRSGAAPLEDLIEEAERAPAPGKNKKQKRSKGK